MKKIDNVLRKKTVECSKDLFYYYVAYLQKVYGVVIVNLHSCVHSCDSLITFIMAGWLNSL